MIAWTKARRFPGVRWCTSSTMAVLPLYLIAIPLRRSFAAAIELRFLVESTALYKSSRRKHSGAEGFQGTRGGAIIPIEWPDSGSLLGEPTKAVSISSDLANRRFRLAHHDYPPPRDRRSGDAQAS